MKGTKRIICLLVAAFLVIGLAACGGGGGTTSTSDGNQTTNTPANNAGSSTTQSTDSGDANDGAYEKIVISYGCPQVVEGYDYNTGDDYSMFILDKFNFEFQGYNLPWGEWHNMLVTWIMAQDMPDVAIFNYNDGTHADAVNVVEQDLLKRLPDDWKTRWPGVAAVYETTSLGPMLEELYGGTYFLPRARFYHNLLGNPLANHWSLWMRSDWIQAVGYDYRNYYSIPEVLEIARLIKDQDPGGLGANLVPISMDAQNSANFFLRANSTHWDTFYKGSSGQYEWGATAPETLEGLKYWYQAYSEGLLDPEFYLLTFEQDMEKFKNLATAGIAYLGAPSAGFQQERIEFTNYTGIDGSAYHIATLLGADGNYHQRDLINYWGTVCFSPDVDDAVFERWMDLMEFTASEEGYPGTSMGIKGVDWDIDANGEIISMVPEGTLLAGNIGEAKYPSLGHVLGSIILWDDLALDNPNVGKSFRDESRAVYQTRYDRSTSDTFTYTDWNIWTHGTENMRRAQGINYWQEFANMITTATSEANLEDIYNTWLTSQMGLIQPVLDELNS